MSIIECKYKTRNMCKQNNLKIKDNEEKLNWKCCETCSCQCQLYLGNDKKKLISELYNDLKNTNNVDEINTMKFIYGHCSEDINDFDSIAYDVSNIRLIVLKKYKELNDCNFCISVWIMRQMHFRLPKFVLKRYNRKLKAIKNTIDEKLYLSTIKDYFSE